MDINQFLNKAQKYLDDLNITEKSKIISELSIELKGQDLSVLDIQNEVNQKRVEHGLAPHNKKKDSNFGSLLIKSFVVITIVFVLFISFLISKFTPVFKIDEKNQRVIILGGLIDIDGKAGKFKVGDDVQFSGSTHKNEFAAKLSLTKAQKEIDVDILSGKYTIKTAKDGVLNIECKLAEVPPADLIKSSSDKISLNFGDLAGSCDFAIPENKTLTLSAEAAHFMLIKPKFDTEISMDNGHIEIAPDTNHSYQYELFVEEGLIDAFQSDSTNAEYSIKARLDNGTIKKIQSN